MIADLFHRRLGSGQPVVVLHGLFGSSDNWGTVGKQLAEDHDVLLVDQRDHGRSPHTIMVAWNEPEPLLPFRVNRPMPEE